MRAYHRNELIGAANLLKVRNAIVYLLEYHVRPPTIEEVSGKSGLDRTTCWRHMQTIEHHGWIDGFKCRRDRYNLSDDEKHTIMDERFGK